MENDKIKVLLLYIVYPLAMGTYFRRALSRNPNIDLKTCGVYTGAWIPWMGGMNLPQKYAVPPTIVLPFPPSVGKVSYDLVAAQLGNWKPDIVLTVDAGICWSSKPHDGIVAHVATDPHVLNYDHQRRISDKFFNMQKVYSQHGDIYLPYAHDPTVHYPIHRVLEGQGYLNADIEQVEADTDAVLIGMPYANRVQWVDELRKHGVSVLFENGPVFDEYRKLNNRARIGLNWSSLDDMNARVFELMAMKLCPVINIVSDLGEFFLEGRDYYGFDNMHDAVSMVLYAKSHPEDAKRIADSAYQSVWLHTYDARVEQILKECRF